MTKLTKHEKSTPKGGKEYLYMRNFITEVV